MRYRVTVRDAARAFGILTVVAGVAAAQGPTPDQLKCEQGASLAIAKFVTTKTKCLIKCEQGARKGTNPATNCSPPYAGATATCVQSAESKAALQEQSKCKKGCPSCYTGGDCVADSTARVQTAETQLDALGPIVFCNDSASPDGLNPFEAKCEDTVAKTLSTFAAAKLKCYSKCQSDLAKGKTTGTCTPPATDTKTAACISKAESKAQLLIDKQCNPAVNAKADPPECYGTNTGSTFVAIAEGGVDGGQAGLYCGSPSGAFLE